MRPKKDIPERNAMELTLYIVVGLSVARTALGFEDLPASLDQSPMFGRVSVVALFAGCLLCTTGMSWRDRDDGALIKQVGLALVAFGSIFYAVALVMSARDYAQAAIAVALSLGVGSGAIARLVQVHRRQARRLAETQAQGNPS